MSDNGSAKKHYQLAGDILASDGYLIETRIVTLQSNFFVFDKNYFDLMHFISLSREPEKTSYLLNPETSNDILRHITRYTHNFLASCGMLVDTTRALIQRYYSKHEFYKEYQAEIQKRFLQDPLHCFIKNLRNFCLHNKLPVSSVKVSITYTGSNLTEAVSFGIDLKSIKSWDGWSKGAVEYLDKQESTEIDIENLTSEYHQKVLDFYSWVWKRLQEIHAPELSNLENLRQEYKKRFGNITSGR